MIGYLPPEISGIPGLLNPSDPELPRRARKALGMTPASECDPDSVLADMDVLEQLLGQCHIGVANGRVPGEAAAGVVDSVRRRVARDRPVALGAALGELSFALQETLIDQHSGVLGGHRRLRREAEPRFTPSEPEPVVSEEVVDGVLCLRVARLHGTADECAQLAQLAADAPRHFGHDRILLDLRGNSGGNDGYLLGWGRAGALPGQSFPLVDETWVVDGKPLSAWNQTVFTEAAHGPEAVQPVYREFMFTPGPDVARELATVDHREVPLDGQGSWDGSLVILTDANTGSSGESSAWLLRHLLAGIIAGAPSKGCIAYGNVTQYLLPHTPLFVQLPTKHNDFGFPVELQGFPVDVACDVTADTSELARGFDRLWGQSR